MGNESSSLPAGAPGSNLRSQRDEEIPYTQYSISKPIDSHSPRQSPRPQKASSQSQSQSQQLRPHQTLTNNKQQQEKEGGTPKHDIVVVADGYNPIKDPDPELTKLNTIPLFYPIMRGSVNQPTNSYGGNTTRDSDLLDKLDQKQILQLCIRYQEHLRQLSEAVAFDQNALCIRIKEIDYTVNMLMNTLSNRQKKFSKYAEQFSRVTETVTTLKKIHNSMNDILPKMEMLNQMLPASEQLETFSPPSASTPSTNNTTTTNTAS